MTEAVRAVQEKEISMQRAVELYGVPRTTLYEYVHKGKLPVKLVNKAAGGKLVFPLFFEESLVSYILVMKNKFYGLTFLEIRQIAYQLAISNNIENPFKNESAGRNWLNNFLFRHKDKLCGPTGIFNANALRFTKESVYKFYDILEEEFRRHNYAPHRIFNVDVTGIAYVKNKRAKIIGLRGQKEIGALTVADRSLLVTLVSAMSASGIFIPPMLIFSRKNMTRTLMKGAPLGTIGGCHPSGWIQPNLFTEWFNHFIETTKPTAASPVLLILDGNYPHAKNLHVLIAANNTYVTIISIPPHSTQLLQPLEKTFMCPLKSCYSEEIRQLLLHTGKPLTSEDIAELLGRAYLKCQTKAVAINGFKATGIYPVDRNVYTEADFEAC